MILLRKKLVPIDQIPRDGYTHTYKFPRGTFEPKTPITAPLVKELGAFTDNGLVCQYMEWADGKKELLIFSETHLELGMKLKLISS